MQPILTVVVPSYNVEGFLPQDLPTYCDDRLRGRLEVIVVDDGSTDGTAGVAQEFCAADPQTFRLVSKDNGGHGSAVNAGFAAARGRFVRVVDADDWVDTDGLARLLDVLERTTADLVVDVKHEVDMATRRRTRFPLPAGVAMDTPIPFEEACDSDEVAAGIMIHTLTVRRDLVERVGMRLLEKTFYVDFEYVVKATLDAASVQFCDIDVYNYLVGNASQSVSQANYVRRFDDHERVCRVILDLYRDRCDTLTPARRAYLLRRCALVCNTHYNIALIFDPERSRGLARAKAFHELLGREYPDVAAVTNRRYVITRVLHALGFDSQAKLDKLTGRKASFG